MMHEEEYGYSLSTPIVGWSDQRAGKRETPGGTNLGLLRNREGAITLAGEKEFAAALVQRGHH